MTLEFNDTLHEDELSIDSMNIPEITPTQIGLLSQSLHPYFLVIIARYYIPECDRYDLYTNCIEKAIGSKKKPSYQLFKFWFARIVTNECINYHRYRKHKHMEDINDYTLDVVENQKHFMDVDTIKSIAKHVLLPKEYKCFNLLSSGYKYEDIRKELNINSINTIKTIVRTLRKKLREPLGEILSCVVVKG